MPSRAKPTSRLCAATVGGRAGQAKMMIMTMMIMTAQLLTFPSAEVIDSASKQRLVAPADYYRLEYYIYAAAAASASACAQSAPWLRLYHNLQGASGFSARVYSVFDYARASWRLWQS